MKKKLYICFTYFFKLKKYREELETQHVALMQCHNGRNCLVQP